MTSRAAQSGLEAEVHVGLGSLHLSVDVRVGSDETVTVLGPNGAGKTTLLRALAGLAPLGRGRVVLDGETLEDPTTGAYLPPERRRIGMVFQDQVLFPHLSALENVAFGPRCRGARRSAARRQAGEWLERVGLSDRAGARAGELSGGQAQRVALARALAGEPRLLLLDEPLTALDATTRPALRRELRRHLDDFAGTRLVVTHDPVEAMALGDRLLVLEAGRVAQSGTREELTSRPRSPYVANLVGVNLFEGHACRSRVQVEGLELVVPGAGQGEVLVVVHPRAVALHRSRPDGTPRNVWRGVVEGVDPEGERARVRVTGPLTVVSEVTPAAVTDLGLAPGGPVWVAVKATDVQVYEA
ncbi:MAG: ABC transporter ATP-binding protein [Actinomycetota bacterium]|nr:ABC transporter ATP-binding protein [Actinomycetota bacterium]